jgi:toxin-antitoxin system PIN domain toxin
MVLVDVNLLIHAVNADSPDHVRARAWLRERLTGPESVALPWAVLIGFVRITTHPRILPNPLPLEDALRQVEHWRSLPNVAVLQPTPSHAQQFASLCRAATAAGNLVTDAHLAALALEHDVELASCDTDFGRFAGVRWFNPLAR